MRSFFTTFVLGYIGLLFLVAIPALIFPDFDAVRILTNVYLHVMLATVSLIGALYGQLVKTSWFDDSQRPKSDATKEKGPPANKSRNALRDIAPIVIFPLVLILMLFNNPERCLPVDIFFINSVYEVFVFVSGFVVFLLAFFNPTVFNTALAFIFISAAAQSVAGGGVFSLSCQLDWPVFDFVIFVSGVVVSVAVGLYVSYRYGGWRALSIMSVVLVVASLLAAGVGLLPLLSFVVIAFSIVFGNIHAKTWAVFSILLIFYSLIEAPHLYKIPIAAAATATLEITKIILINKTTQLTQQRIQH